MSQNFKDILENPIFRIVNTILLTLFGIIGYLYVEGQGSLIYKVKDNSDVIKLHTEDLIEVRSDLKNFKEYNKQIIEDINRKLDRVDQKLDRLLENR